MNDASSGYLESGFKLQLRLGQCARRLVGVSDIHAAASVEDCVAYFLPKYSYGMALYLGMEYLGNPSPTTSRTPPLWWEKPSCGCRYQEKSRSEKCLASKLQLLQR